MNRLLQWAGQAVLACLGLLASASGAEIELLVRADDMGVCQAANEACIRSYRDGVVRSVEVIVPGAWLLDAARALQDNPGLDVGVHLTLTSEWERCKWRPLTQAPSLVDGDGYFRPMTRQRKDFPPNTGFLEANPDLGEVERELRAQIQLAKKHIPRVSHVSAHMGTPTCTPQLKALVIKLAGEYGLRMEDGAGGLRYAAGFAGRTPAEREESLAQTLSRLTPGRWLLIEHPGADTPEMRGLGHVGYYYVAEERDAVTKAFTSPRVKQIVAQRGIRLIAYRDLP